MKRKVAKVGRLRLSPNEEAQLIKAENERRRKLRLQQVREQERYIALQIRKEVQQRRERELQKLAGELKEEWEKQQREKLQALDKLYQDSLAAVGEGHRGAKENEPDWEALAQKAEENHERAEERHREALKELKWRRQKQQEEQTRHIQARRKAVLAEKERAARVASLPPRPPDPFETIEVKKTPPLKMSDVDCFSVTRHHLLETVVDSEVDTEQRDAWLVAAEEGCRLEELDQEGEREMRERLEKAQLRGEHALKKERLAKDHERFIQQLGHLQQADLLRRRQRVAHMPMQIFHPPYQRQEMEEDRQRDLEIAFEDLYSGERKVKGDLVLQLVPEPLPTLSTGSQDLDVTLESTAEEGTEMRDESQTVGSTARERGEPEEQAHRHVLKKLLDRIRAQRVQQGSRSTSETAGDSTSIETGSLDTEERELPRPTSQETPTEPEPVPPAPAPEVTEDLVVVRTLLHHEGRAVEISKMETERKKQDEDLERQKREQLELLQQLEEQRCRLEQHLEVAHVGKAAPPARSAPSNLPAQQQDNGRRPAEPAEVTPMSQDTRPSAAEDEHSRRIRQYQQRLLEQNRLHKQSVDHARRRLEEYQSLLKMKYPAMSSQPRLDPPPRGTPAVPAVPPTTSILRHSFPRESQGQQRLLNMHPPASALRSGNDGTWTDPALNVPSQDRSCASVTVLPPTGLVELSQPSLQTTQPSQVSAENRLPGMELHLRENVLCDGPRVVPEKLGSYESQLGCSGTVTHWTPLSPLPAMDLQVTKQSSAVLQLQDQIGLLDSEAGLETEALVHKASLSQQRAQQQAELAGQQQVAHDEDEGAESEALLSKVQLPPAHRAGSALGRAERLRLMSVLLEAIQRETLSQPRQPGSSSSSTGDRPSPTSSVSSQPLGTYCSSQVDFSSVFHPRAIKPPLARTKLGVLEMIEKHELSVIPEVETPVDASLAMVGEESSEASCAMAEEQKESEGSSCTGHQNSESLEGSESCCLDLTAVGSTSSSRVTWRERLCEGSGRHSQLDSAVVCTFTDVHHTPNTGQEGLANNSVRASTEQLPTSPRDSASRCSPSSSRYYANAESLFSTTVSTGSFSTNEPDLSSVCTGETPPCISSRSGRLGQTAPACELVPCKNSVQEIIEKYTKELNTSLSMAGTCTGRNDSSLGDESYSTPPLPVVSGQQSTSWSRAFGGDSVGLCSEHTLRTEHDVTGQVLGEDSSSYLQDKEDDFLPLEPKPDLDSSSSSSSQRLGQLEQIRKAEGWDLAMRRIIERLADRSSSQHLEEDSTRLSVIIDELLNESCQWQDSERRTSTVQHSNVTGGCAIHLQEGEALDCKSLQCLVGVGSDLCYPQHINSSDPSTQSPPPQMQVSRRCGQSLTGSLPEQPHIETTLPVSPNHPLSPIEHERTLTDTASDSFHPLLTEPVSGDTGDFSPSAYSAVGSPALCSPGQSQASEACPEQLRADLLEASTTSSHASLLQLLSPSPQRVTCHTLLEGDLLPEAHRSYSPVFCHPPTGAVCSGSLSDDLDANGPFALGDPVNKGPQSTSASVSKITPPVWDRMLGMNDGRGILEEPELTLVSLTDTTLQEDEEEKEEEQTCTQPETDRTIPSQCDVDTNLVFTLGETSKDCKAPVRGERSAKEELAASCAVMLVEFEATAGSLQKLLLQKRQDFIQRSARRQEELKARRHRETSQHASQPARRSKVKTQEEPPAAVFELKKVGEVKVCAPEQRKMEEAEMYRRTERLYNQLEEVKQLREMRTRQELGMKYRERAKEFQKKTLQKLRSRHNMR